MTTCQMMHNSVDWHRLATKLKPIDFVFVWLVTHPNADHLHIGRLLTSKDAIYTSDSTVGHIGMTIGYCEIDEGELETATVPQKRRFHGALRRLQRTFTRLKRAGYISRDRIEWGTCRTVIQLPLKEINQ